MIKEQNKQKIYLLTLDLCEELYNSFIEQIHFDEQIPPFNTRFPGKLEAILGTIELAYDKKYVKNNITMVSACYFYQIIAGHPFQNGNKRLGLLYTHVFLQQNNKDFNINQDELYKMAVEVANLGSNHKPNIIKAIIEDYFSKHIIDLKNSIDL